MTMRKFLSSCWWFVTIGILFFSSTALLGVQAWNGDQFSGVALAILGSSWFMFALLGQHYLSDTIKSWKLTIAGWNETNELLLDYCSLFSEALDELYTYDRERAEEISGRAVTIGRMRGNRLKEIEGERHR